ncbi:MAG TPA: ATP-dependent protease ATPase subunit HslU [Phycisphaerae bacterium]|nr:ATP-dependent protease ATPase subunit HslU [Phycisphaerae bacterium]
MAELTPKQIVEALDRHIIGQDDAKRAVAVAIRNRWRRQQLPEHMRQEVGPKNIIMIGPTGVGKTEIARRLADLVNAPMVKVEASKYTEVGYHGRDVESMVRDLADVGIHMVRQEQTEVVRTEAERRTEEVLLDALMPPSEYDRLDHDAESETAQRRYRSREKLRAQLKAGDLEDSLIELTVDERASPVGMFATVGMDQLGPEIQNLMDQFMPAQTKPRRMPVHEARKVIFQQQCDKLIDRQKVAELAAQRTENSGIIFVDEIDKVCGAPGGWGPDVSRQGVQRDLLPIVEGCTVNTRAGPIRTDHILCIAAGAFHRCKPSDLMPELQGRFPIRVELSDLSAEDFRRILTEPEGALIKQQVALMATEGLTLEFSEEAITALAETSYKVNQNAQNIGARRLHSTVEKLMETLSFEAPDRRGDTVTIDEDYVRERLKGIAEDETLIRFGFHSLREDS